MKQAEFTQAVQATYNRHFPTSRASVRFVTGLGHSLFINCYLVADSTELSGGIWNNDVLSVCFMIDQNGNPLPKDTDEMPELLLMEVTQSSYAIKPESRMLAFSRRKFSWRKVTGNSTKVLQALDKYFGQLHASLQNDLAAGNFTDVNHLAAVQNHV